MSLAPHRNDIRLTLDPGGLYGLPVEGAVEAGNKFFDDLNKKGVYMIKPTAADADRFGKYALDWWEGKGEWQGQGRSEDFKSTKLWMVYMVLAGSKYGAMVPRKNLGHVLLGSLCVTGREYTTIEWTAAETNGAALVSCTSVPAESGCCEMDRFPTLRTNLAACIQEEFITNPQNRKVGETFSRSATNFVVMRISKELGLRGAGVEPILRLFSPCRCPHTASSWDVLAQDWQKTSDVTYACSGSNEGRIIWRPSKIEFEYDDVSGNTGLNAEKKRSLTCLMPCCFTRLCQRFEIECYKSDNNGCVSQATQTAQESQPKGGCFVELLRRFKDQCQFDSWGLWSVLLLIIALLCQITTIGRLEVRADGLQQTA